MIACRFLILFELFNRNTNFLYNRTNFFLKAQAFTSPTDMASSSVRENVFLTKTPTSDGVCGKLLYIILNFLLLSQMFIDDIF